MADDFARVGVIFVHGIGEQRRYEHLDGEVRNIIRAIERTGPCGGPDLGITVELRDANTAAFLSEQNTWQMDGGGAPVRAVVRDRTGSLERHLFFHEVWWADANETYSLGKQARFWGWAATVWNIHAKFRSSRPGATQMDNPPLLSAIKRLWVRIKLFCISYLFTFGALTVGLLVFLAKRLLDLNPPDVIRVFINYLSAIKLYNQKVRAGGGFLDARLEPPRVSVRRRMIRAISEVAMAGYDRWYIVAHSLGTVVAFNGIMETGHAWPNYLDQEIWRHLKQQMPPMAGPKRPADIVGPTNDMSPVRPLWLAADEVAYRDQLFATFDGFITYGSPLNKFAAIWPARVPRNKTPEFAQGFKWLNFYDPIDPVSGDLDDWFGQRTSGGNNLRNIGFRSHFVILYAHIRYLNFDATSQDRGVAGHVADILIGLQPSLSPRFFTPGTTADRVRRISVSVQWAGVFALVTLITYAMVRYAGPHVVPVLRESAAGDWACRAAVWTGAIMAAVFVFVLVGGWFTRFYVGLDSDDARSAGGNLPPEFGAPPAPPRWFDGTRG